MRLFISDLHLQQERPDITGAFLSFLRDTAAGAQELYILGDLFEVWVGDDAMGSFELMIADALRQLGTSGCRIFLLHGNRDFLLGKKFCRLAGCQLLRDPAQIELTGARVLLLHGDSLCTDDREYQRMKKLLRNPLSLLLLRCLPLSIRQRLAGNLRQQSRRRTRMKAADITDVNQQEVTRIMARHNVSIMIHGHTHRPAIHQLNAGRRIVLGDWEENYQYLQADAHSLQLRKVTIEPLLLAAE